MRAKLIHWIDMKTLERMTGKDFSGPIPEIRAPPPSVPSSRRAQEQESTEDAGAQNKTGAKQVKKRSRSRTGGLEDGVVIIGDVNDVPA
jgi:transcription factor TFIIIB component B''